MKKIRMTAWLPMVVLFVLAVVLASVSAFFLWRDGFESLSIGHFSGVFSLALLGCIFKFPNKIIISDDHIFIVNFPLFATNSFYVGKADLIKWNTMIHFSEIDNVELVNLTPDERVEYYGTKTLLNQFLKIDIKDSDKSKFIYISIYSKKQMDKLMEIISSKMTSKDGSIQ